jgi:hypothetical protein
MAVRVEHYEDQCQLVAHVSCKNISSNGEMEKTFADLDTALNRIEENLGNPDIYYFLINIEADRAPAGPSAFDPYDGEYGLSDRNPWEAFCPPFWTKAGAVPQLRQRAKDYIGRLEKTLKLAETHSRSTASLWEHDETQFGEPVAAHLALLDVEFVPCYTRLLRSWDPGHQVHIGQAVSEIVNKYGIRAETEELILSYTDWSGSDELGLRKSLKIS